ncbi:hypothetical protein DPV78_003372 [Talaromyces pinophilus]|nr:hypothetical protein DPV78_003372 [Talaromyces pinophilus]
MARFIRGNQEESASFSNDLMKSFAAQGFLKIINHGILDIVLEKAFDLKYPHPPCANPNRGWVALGQEKSSAITDFEKGKIGADCEIFDVKESFDIGNLDDPLYANIWPDEDELPDSRLSKEDRPFNVIDHCLPNASEMHLNLYPQVDIKDLRSGSMSRISEHTDFETSEVSKLMINPIWGPIFLSSANLITLPISQAEREEGVLDERLSGVYFAKMAQDNSIYPFREFVSADNPAKYPAMSAFEWNQIKLEKLYGVC